MARILVIDDDRPVGATVQSVLATAGHAAVVADSGTRGLDLLRSENFDLLIVDIFMPGMDGLETIRQVHRIKPALPVVVMSGHSFRTSTEPAPDFLSMAIKLGATSSLRKPFRTRELIDIVARALHG
jgi:CheY-like chemotaxis protein